MHWAERRGDVRALALVGSWARGSAGPDSDVDVVLLTHDRSYVADTGWLSAFPGASLVGTRSWGAIVERRLAFPSGLELEVGVGPPSWAAVDPVDPGTLSVVRDGLRVLYDPDGLLAALTAVSAES